MKRNHHDPNRRDTEPGNLQQGLPGEPFLLGVYPVFDDDLPRDFAYENFSAPDLRDMRLYPWGLE